MDGPWRAVYTMPVGLVTPTYWVQAFAHELMHVAGYVRGTLPVPGRELAGFASTHEEETVADAGAVVLCRLYGVEPDMAYVRAGVWDDAVRHELRERLALVTRCVRTPR